MTHEVGDALENRAIALYSRKDLIPAGAHPRNYNAPEAQDFGLIMNTDVEATLDQDNNCFIVHIRKPEGGYAERKISYLHKNYDSLHYVLLFPRGEPGWCLDFNDRGRGGDKVTSLSCLLYTSPSPRDKRQSRMPSSA